MSVPVAQEGCSTPELELSGEGTEKLKNSRTLASPGGFTEERIT